MAIMPQDIDGHDHQSGYHTYGLVNQKIGEGYPRMSTYQDVGWCTDEGANAADV